MEEVEKHTKIRGELLEALEEDNYKKLPPSTFVQGFIKNYGKFLGLDHNKLLAVFRRDFEAKKHPPAVLESFTHPIDKRELRITPGKVIGASLIAIILIFFGYLWVEYRQFVGAPNLQVISPTEGESVDVPSVLVEGKTDPEVKVSINNQQIGVDQSGNFNEDIKLSSSQNQIVITATSKFGQSATMERTVFVKK